MKIYKKTKLSKEDGNTEISSQTDDERLMKGLYNFLIVPFYIALGIIIIGTIWAIVENIFMSIIN